MPTGAILWTVAYSRAPCTSLTFVCFVSEWDRAPAVRLSACPACTLVQHHVVSVVLVRTAAQWTIHLRNTRLPPSEHRYSTSTSSSASDAANLCSRVGVSII